jgi:hypothetical protein
VNGHSTNGQLASILLVVFTALVTLYIGDLADRIFPDNKKLGTAIASDSSHVSTAIKVDSAQSQVDSTGVNPDSTMPVTTDTVNTTKTNINESTKAQSLKTFPLPRDYFLGGIIIVIVLIAFVQFYFGKIIVYGWGIFTTRFSYDYILENLEYLDGPGSSVSYTRHEHITNLKRWRIKGIRATIAVEGTIDRNNTYSINGAFTFPSDGQMMMHCNFHSFNIHRREHYSSYSTVFDKSFIKPSENWEFGVQSRCLFYEIKITIPSDRNVLSVFVKYYDLRKDNDWDGSHSYRIPQTNNHLWHQVVDPKVLIVKEKGATCVVMQLTNVKKSDRYKINWIMN